MKRVLSIAGREADIVGINPSIPSGQVDTEAARSGAADAGAGRRIRAWGARSCARRAAAMRAAWRSWH